jgi:predicted mannosyl-3-phosphoglycerate phosphatase (HAD superfamily)|tara:strand:+ start:16207 stop:16581 length:375 start_codon:yes stop_codon:yes gene_type:complete
MKKVATQFKNNTIAVDFDGVIHQYSKGFQGLENVYDPPMPGAVESLQKLKDMGYRLIIVSSRTVEPILNWLDKYNLGHFFDDVTNIKHPAKYYIDDHGLRFEKKLSNAWENVIEFIEKEENNNE